MRTKELPAIEYPAEYTNDNHTYFQTEEMADNPNKQVHGDLKNGPKRL